MMTPDHADGQTIARNGSRTTSDALVDMIPKLRIYARNLIRGEDEADDLV